MKNIIKKILLLFGLISLIHFSFSQKTDSLKSISYFSGAMSVTNNGISIVPSFSLGKPAAIFNLSMGKNRFSFEPDLWFSLAGKPWTFLFWGRYKLIIAGKFQMNVGTHLGLNFKSSVLPIGGDSSNVTVTRRYLAGELFPRFLLAKNISVGIYYLYSHGIDAGTIKNTNFSYTQCQFFKYQIVESIFHEGQPSILLPKTGCTGWFLFYIDLYSSKEKFSTLCFSDHQQNN